MDVATVLLRSRWFAQQPAPLRAALIGAGRIVRLGAGQWVYGEGDEQTGLCAVIEGALRLEASAGHDRNVLIDIAAAVSIFGQSQRRGGGPRIVTARAGPPSAVMLISDHALERIAHDIPDVWRAVSALFYGQLDASVHLAANLLALPPRARIAARLRALATTGEARVSQSELAELCGLSRKATNAHLAAIERAGAIRRGYGTINIVAPQLLDRLAA